MKRQAGFTLIELVMVIVILGILSAFALPRFADLGTEARVASLNGALGAVKSASSIAHASFLVAGDSNAGTAGIQVDLEGTEINMTNGYPEASATVGITAAAQIANDFTVTSTATVTTVAATGATGTCSFTYTEATATVAPVISTATTTGC
jgi:MSHA pilin protein MshA